MIKSSLDRFTNDLRAISSKELAIFTALQNELANKKDLSDTRNGRFDERLARIIGYTGKLKAERYTTQDELYNKVNELIEKYDLNPQSLKSGSLSSELARYLGNDKEEIKQAIASGRLKLN